jgi:hypothetical protein
MAAVTGYGSAALLRMNAVSVLVGAPLMRPRFASFAYVAMLFLLAFSVMSLCAAVWGIIFAGVVIK